MVLAVGQGGDEKTEVGSMYIRKLFEDIPDQLEIIVIAGMPHTQVLSRLFEAQARRFYMTRIDKLQ